MKQNNTNTEIEKNENIRFTTLINPLLLSQIKLISYISNKKLYDIINLSIQQFIDTYNKNNSTNIQTLIDLQQKNSTNTPLNPTNK